MAHLLVTNDFPPKVGGIQTYLWELWRRLDPTSYVVMTSSAGRIGDTFDREQSNRGVRILRLPGLPWLPGNFLAPTPRVAQRIREVARSTRASLVLFDPAVPLGLLGRSVGLPYGVVLHGAEVTVPSHLPVARQALRRVLSGAHLVIAAGSYPADEARRIAGCALPPVVEIPPGVDVDRLRPLEPQDRLSVRQALGVGEHARLVTSVSRLVPRKGMDRLIQATSELAPSFPDLQVVIAGAGRDRRRLARLRGALGAPVRLLGEISDKDKARLLGASDLFVMACRSRWGGLEQEGFGIVFLEAAAVGVAQVAGRSGGAHEAVEDGVTGVVVDRPQEAAAIAVAMRQLLTDDGRCRAMGRAARRRVEESFDQRCLARRLAQALAEVEGAPGLGLHGRRQEPGVGP